MQCFFHHSILLYIQVQKRLLQVPYSPMNKFRRPTACARREVIHFYESRFETLNETVIIVT